MDNLQQIKTIKRTKRVGRGPSSGKGKTCGRGMNGQRSRTGASTSQIEGGQTKLIMRLPKVGGFKSKMRKKALPVTTDTLGRIFSSDEKITADLIIEKLKIKNPSKISVIKVIKGRGDYKFSNFSDEIVCSTSVLKEAEASDKPSK